MASMSYFLAEQILASSLSQSVYIALTTSAVGPNDDGHSIYEPSALQYTNYARVVTNLWSAVTSSNGITSIANAEDIIFPTVANTSAGTNIVGYAVTDNPTVGKVLYYGTIPTSMINSDITPQLPIGTLVISIQ